MAIDRVYIQEVSDSEIILRMNGGGLSFRIVVDIENTFTVYRPEDNTTPFRIIKIKEQGLCSFPIASGYKFYKDLCEQFYDEEK